MTDYLPLIYDAALVALIVIAAVRAWRRGFLSSLVRFVGWAAALAVAAVFSKPLANLAYDALLKERVASFVQQNIDAGVSALSSGTLAAADSLESVRSSVSGAISSLLERLGLENTLFAGATAEDSASAVLENISQTGADATDAIAQNAIAPAVTTVLQILIFLLLFALAMLLFRLLSRAFRGVNKVPVLGGVNKVLGGALGVGQGLILAYLAVLALVFLAGVSRGQWPWLTSDALEKTYLTRALMNFKLPS